MITKLRQSLTRILFPIGVLLALGTLAAPARDQTEAPGAGITPPQASDGGVIETIAAIVHGLSGNDLLNVRPLPRRSASYLPESRTEQW